MFNLFRGSTILCIASIFATIIIINIATVCTVASPMTMSYTTPILLSLNWLMSFMVVVLSPMTSTTTNFVAPDISDRAHDSFKEMAVYWKMSKCGF
jgi:hypothetical protein